MLHTFRRAAIEWPKNTCERTVFMARFFFLGANSKDGFVSLLPQFRQESPRRLYTVKGGPGCGKSTCIRRLSEALGGAEEYFLCSSDPDSLDGAALPGLALLDGTAPHVFEPAFPGCDGDYLSLPPFLDREGLETQAPALYALKAASAAHYAQAYRLLKAAALLREDRRERAAALLTRQPEGRTGALLREIPKAPGPGVLRRRFLDGVTPRGCLCLWDTVTDNCRRVIALRDSYGLAGPLLEGLLEGALDRGQEVCACYDPVEPQRLRHLLLPGCSLAFVTHSGRELPFAPTRMVHIDAMLDAGRLAKERPLLRLKKHTEDSLLEDAVSSIAAAHTLHDHMEAIYRPHIDLAAMEDHYSKLLKQITA